MQIIKWVGVIFAGLAGFTAVAVEMPAGYTQLEWVRSTGQQSLNTGWKASGTLRATMDFVPLEQTGNSMLGTAKSDVLQAWRFFNYSGGFIFDCASNNGAYIRVGQDSAKKLDCATRYVLECGINDSNQVYARATEVGTGTVIAPAVKAAGGTPPESEDVYVFGGYVKTTMCYERMKLYSLQLSDVVNGARQLVRDFVPCRAPTYEVGLWDRVEGKFYATEGKGRLVCPDDPATKVTYLIANGFEHVTTGVYATKTLQAELDWAPLAATGDIVVGTHVDTNDAVAWRYFNASWHYYFDCGCGSGSNGRVSDGGTMTSGTRYLSKFGTENDNANLAYLDVTRLTDNVKVVNHKTNGSSNVIESQPVSVCGGNMKGTFSHVAMRLWSLKLLDIVDGTRQVVGDYVPTRQTGGEVGLGDRANNNAFLGNTGKGAFNWGGIAYTEGGGVLAVHEGTLAEAEQTLNDFSVISKVGHYAADFSGVASYPALNLAEGTLSFQNGATGAYAVTGTLTLTGGTHLQLDVSETACDHFTAGTVALVASASNPIVIDVAAIQTNHQYAAAYTLMPLPAGAEASAADCFVANSVEVPFRFRVENGNLVMYPRTDLIVSATWKGDTRSPASYALDDPANWTCVNPLGTVVPDALPTDETAVIIPTGGTFNWPKGATLAYKSVQLPATLGGDCDWSGYPLPLAGAINLGGHTLTVAQPDGTATIANGTLKMVVGPGETRAARSVNDTILPGENVKFVFESASEHPIEVNDKLLMKAGDIDVLAGTLRLVRGNLDGAAVPGTLFVAAGATLDFNLPDNVYTKLPLNEPTHGKTLVLAGAIVNDGSGAEGPNALVSHLVVKEGATIGGRTENATGSVMNRIDYRVLSGSAETNLTIEGAVPLTAVPGVKNVFCLNSFALDRLDNRGGWVQFEGTCTGTITNGLHCYGGTFGYWSSAVMRDGLAIVVEEGTTDLYHPACTVSGQSIEIKEGATLHGDGTNTLIWNGVLKGNGNLTGVCIQMGGDQSCWQVEANAAGFTSIVKIAAEDLAFITNLKMFDVELDGDSLPEKLAVCPAGSTTAGQASLITVRIHTPEGRECAVGWLTVEEVDGVATVVLNVAQGTPIVTALWKGWNDPSNLLAPANWVCSNATDVVEGGYPTEVTAVTVPGGSDFTCPAATPLVCRTFEVGGQLAADRDWSGVKSLFVGTLDLNGRALTLGCLNGTATIENTAETRATVRVTVPTGATVPADYATVQLGENIAFVKDGAGELDVQDTVVAQAGEVTLQAGLTRIVHGKQTAASRPGTILIETEATLDANLPERIHTNVGLNDPTHGKTIRLRGTFINDTNGTIDANALLGHVIVEQGGRIGGPSERENRIDMRVLSGSANNVSVIEGAVPLTLLPHNFLVFSGVTANLDRIDNQGCLWLEATISGTITNGIHCSGASEVRWWSNVVAPGLTLVIEDGICDITQSATAYTENQMNLEVKDGAVFNKVGPVGFTWNGRLSGNGTVQGYAFVLGGADSCWAMKADDTGFTEKVTFAGEVSVNVFKTLARIEVQYTGDPTVPRRLVLAPCGWLTQAEADAIELVVTDANGAPIEGFHLYVNGEQQLELQVGFATIEKATYIGAGVDPNDLSDPANWSCTTAGLPVTGVPMALTELTIPGDKVFTCTNASQIAYAKINFPSTLPGDSDWRGLGAVAIDTAIDLNGHKLHVSDLKGTGTLYSGVQEIEWIESDGGQYIDTGLTPKATLQAEMDFIPREHTGEANVGAFVDDKTDWRFSAYQGGAFFDCGNARAGATSNGAIMTLGTRYAAKFGMEGSTVYNRIYYAGGGATLREQTTGANGSVNTSRTIYVFANNKGGTAMCAKMRLYSLKFWDVTADGKQLVRDFVPARRAGDGMAGLFDRVACVFYPNKGATPFQGSISTYTGAVGLSELHINVPAPRTVDNATVAISGGIKVVKEGGGTLRATKTGQTYGGGTVVEGGQLMAKKEGYPWSGANGEVVVNSNGVFNVWGGGDCVSPTTVFILAGGTIANLVGDCGTGNASLGTVRLTADSTFDITYSLGFVGGGYAPTLLDLGGHELTVNLAVGKRFYVDNCEMTKGKLTVTSGGWLTCDKTSVRASQTDFDLNCALTLNCPVDVHDLTMRNGASGYREGAGPLNIHGTYTPIGNYIWHFNMMNGSAIDLRNCPLPLPAESNLTCEEGAVVKVKFNTADLVPNTPLITWNAKPNARFTAAANLPCGLVARDDGLYAITGLALFLR